MTVWVTLADVAGVVLTGKSEPDVLRLLERVKARRIPLHVIGGEKPAKVKRVVEKKDNPPSEPCLPPG